MCSSSDSKEPELADKNAGGFQELGLCYSALLPTALSKWRQANAAREDDLHPCGKQLVMSTEELFDVNEERAAEGQNARKSWMDHPSLRKDRVTTPGWELRSRGIGEQKFKCPWFAERRCS